MRQAGCLVKSFFLLIFFIFEPKLHLFLVK
jgi:hypothetical protein